MRKQMFILLAIVLLFSCNQQRIPEGDWIDSKTEKHLISIKSASGKLQLYGFNGPISLKEDGNKIYYQYKQQKFPLYYQKDSALVKIFDTEYIPLSKSKKGQFQGRWVNTDKNIAFHVQLDDNMDLTWDIIKGQEKAVRFYPKLTEDGCHFTLGQDTLAFKLSKGILVDAQGTAYKRRQIVTH